MVRIICQSSDTLRLYELAPFQGDLKKRTKKNIRMLADSILNDGLIMPFAIWKNNGGNFLLDGHGRLEALKLLAKNDSSIIEQDFPVLYIEAEDEDTAKKALLQITSQYGRITHDGAVSFTASIPEYHAPSINRFVYKAVKHRKLVKRDNDVMIRIRVKEQYVEDVKRLLGSVDYIKVVG